MNAETEKCAVYGRKDRFRISLIISVCVHVTVACSCVLLFALPKADVRKHAERTDGDAISIEEFYDFTVGETKTLKNGESTLYDSVSEDGAVSRSGSHDGTGQESVLTYNEAVKQLIERKKEYPPNARKRRIQGEIEISFVVDCKGSLKSMIIQKSSGHSILDNAAVSSVQEASPFPPFSSSMKKEEMEMNVLLVYKI